MYTEYCKNVELMGGKRAKRLLRRLRKSKFAKGMAAVATGGVSTALTNKKAKNALKKSFRIATAGATGGLSELATKKKSPKAKRFSKIARLIATGGTSGLVEGNKKSKKRMRNILRVVSVVPSGGASMLINRDKEKRKKAIKLLAAMNTGAIAPMFDKKSKLGHVAGAIYAPVTTGVGAIVKKRQKRKEKEKIAKDEKIAAQAEQALDKKLSNELAAKQAEAEAAMAEAEAKNTQSQNGNNSIKKLLPWGLAAAAAIPLLMGEE